MSSDAQTLIGQRRRPARKPLAAYATASDTSDTSSGGRMAQRIGNPAYRVRVLTAEGETAYRLEVHNTSRGAQSDEVVVAHRVADCDK